MAQCFNPIDIYTREEGRIASQIERNALNELDPYYSFIDRVPYAEGMGNGRKVRRYEDTFIPMEATEFSAVPEINYGENSTDCGFDPVTALNGQTFFQPELQDFDFSSDWFCSEHFENVNDFPRQNAEMIQNLRRNVMRIYSRHARNETRRVALNKIVLTGSMPRSNSQISKDDFPTSGGAPIIPTSRLNQHFLDLFGDELNRNETARKGAYGSVGGSPIYAIFASPQTSTDVFRNSPEIRQDVRYAMPMELMKPWGAIRTAFNFMYTPDYHAARYYLGAPTVSVTSITRSGATATVTTGAAHGLVAGDVGYIAGAASSTDRNMKLYNGAFYVISAPTATTLTYLAPGMQANTATGTITIRKLGAVTGAGYAYIEVDSYQLVQTTYGYKSIPSAIYRDAPYEVTPILNRMGLEFQVPRQPPSGGGEKQEIINYLGELKFQRSYCDTDPWHRNFRWASKFKMATMQKYPEFLYALLHLRCSIPQQSACA